jgi:hypothetical protein
MGGGGANLCKCHTRSMSIRTLLRALWIGCILFGAGILPASAQTRRVILLFDERSELPGLAALDADFVSVAQFCQRR